MNGRPVFQNVGSTIVMQRLGSGCAINIWKEMVEYDELSINWRQKGDQEFFAIPFCHYCYVWHFYYYVSVLLVSCYPFYPFWVTGDRDIPWFSRSLV